MGNFMNDTNKQASGFKLGTLSRLVNLKDDKNQRSLMDYIEMSIRNKFPEWQSFMDDLHECIALEKGLYTVVEPPYVQVKEAVTDEAV
jgi:cytokinesis protein